MTNSIPFSVLEMLTSKVCHDLISPIGAVNNGVEFLEEMGEGAGEEITNLISYSAAQASAKLQAFRLAYGAGGADSSIKPEDVYKIIEDIVSGEKKIKQNWDPLAPLGPEERPKGFCKILISTMLLAMDSLPKGGEIQVITGENNETLIKVTGENAALRECTGEALLLDMLPEELEPKYIHPYMTGLIAQHYRYCVTPSAQEENILILKITPPSE